MLSHFVYVLGILYSFPRITHLRSPKDERGNTAMPCHANNKKRNSICFLTSTVQFWDFHEEPCIVLIRVPSVEPQGRTRQHCNRQIMKTMPKGSVRQFFLSLFPYTFWVAKTNSVSYFPKPWNCMRWKTIFHAPPPATHVSALTNAPQGRTRQHCNDTAMKLCKKQSTSFFGYRFQTHSGSRNRYCFIFP